VGETGAQTQRRYEIVLLGELSDRFASAFGDVDLTRAGGNTVLVCLADQARLHALLERVQELGLSLLSVTPVD
jgi:hypothetical protein